MDNQIQLLSFLISFFFGLFFSFVSRFHYGLVNSLKSWMRYVLSFLFILDLSLFYVLLMYYVNYGAIHLYFVLFSFFGYASEKRVYEYVKKYVNFRRFIDKVIRK